MACADAMSDARLAEIRQRADNLEEVYQAGEGLGFSGLGYRDVHSVALAYHEDVAPLLAEVKRLRAREAELAKALPFLRELAQARTSMLDDDDVLIKVSPGRAAWVISRCRTFLLHLREEA